MKIALAFASGSFAAFALVTVMARVFGPPPTDLFWILWFGLSAPIYFWSAISTEN